MSNDESVVKAEANFLTAEMAEVRTLASLLVDRMQFMRQAGISFEGARDLYETLGYDRLLTNQQYRDRYYRGGIAGRLVEVYPNATWRGGFEVVEDEDPNISTPFESAWETIDKKFKIRSVLRRADLLAGLSTYSVLLIGAPGELYDELPRGTPDKLLYFQPYCGGGGLNARARQVTVDADVTIQSYDEDTKSPRFGQPETYLLRRTDFAATNFNLPVHWTRVIHLAEGLLDNEVYGLPALERVWNLLDDLDKITGGGAEAFWLRANQGVHINFDKDMKDIKPAEISALKANLEEYKHRIDRFIRTRGTEINTLGSDVANFSNPADAVLTQIAGAKGIPKRILTGSEMGELASSQDRDNWKDQVNGRQTNYAEPNIVLPLIDRLLKYGYLPPLKKGPDSYQIKWSPMVVMTEEEKFSGASVWAGTKNADGTPVYTTAEIRDHWYGKPPLTPKQIDEEKKLQEAFKPEPPPAPTAPEPSAGIPIEEQFQIDTETGFPVLKAAGEHSYASTQVNAPDSIRELVDLFQSSLPDDVVMRLEDTPHVTVKYGIRTDRPRLVEMLLRDNAPVKIQLGPTNIFTSDEYDVVYAEVYSPDLVRMNQEIAMSLSVADTHTGYVPHLTLAYLRPGTGVQYVGNPLFLNESWTAEFVRFSTSDEQVTDIPLLGESAEEMDSEVLELLTEAIQDGDDDTIDLITLGGRGSGNFGHSGRPGQVGGSGVSEGFREPKGAKDEARMKELRIPPAWKNVLLNPDKKGALQAVGVDDKGRKQYRYSAARSAQKSAEKFDRLGEFNKDLPRLRSQILRDLESKDSDTREAAAVMHLIERTGFRIGGEGDTGAEKKAYGASTLLAKHVKVKGDTVYFTFTGKKGVEIEKEIRDKELAAILKPRVMKGGRLFDTNDHSVRSYFKSFAPNFSPKDFRTWHGTNMALKAIREMSKPKNAAEYKQFRNRVAKRVSDHLGNTPSVALKSYISPEVFDRWDK